MDIRAFFSPPGGKSKPKNKNVSEKKDEQNSSSSSSANGSRSQGRGKNKKEPKASKAKATSSSEDNEAEVKKQTKKSRKEQVIKVGSDSDEEPLSSKLRKDTVVEAKKKTTKKKRSSYFDESDEEEVLPPKLMKESKDGKKKLQDTKKVSPSKSKSSPSPLKETTAADFFGASPIERTSSRRAIAVKRKQPSDEDTMKCSSEPKVVTSDDKDSKDGKRPAKKRKDDSSEQSASKQKQSTAKAEPKSTPASKLAKAAATTKFTVAETPEKSPKKALPEKQTHMTTAKEGSPKKQITPSKPEKTTDKEEMVIPPSLEKKKSGYRSFMMRDGPRALGSKEIPQGAENCFEGLTFVITGVLDAIERDDAVDLIQRYGGKVTSAVSKKTSYLIVGRDPGESKTKKADQVGTKKIDEDGLLELVRTKPGKKSVHEVQCEKTVTPKKSKSNSQQSEASQSPQKGVPSGPVSTPTRVPGSSPSLDHGQDKSLLWVDKYRPSTLKHIIGQQGDKSNMRKLLKWLKDWHSNRNKPHNKSSFFQKDQDGKIFKAALLSGPPGVGKTTTSQLVCQELGFSYIEMNASDSRNKKTLEQSVSQLLNNKSMDGFLTGTKTEAERHALIMDEVDGMAGNEDRGGMQELIALIKNSKIPVICMCNDRNSPKIRSLANYCFDLRFQRPRVEQIKGAMMSIAFKEGLKIPAPAMDQIITGANQDIRQVLNNLAMWTATEKVMSYDQAKADASKAQKDIKMGSFDAVRKLLSGAESSKLSINEKSDMFFSDYSIMPLFVQENYLSVMPNKAGGNVKKTLELMSKTADALCDGDLVENHIRSGGQWSLLPTQAMFSCVIPSDLISGGMGGRIDFPQWLGKNSKKGRISRILQELQVHLRLSASGSKMAVNLDYVPHLRRAMTGPLMTQESDEISSGVARVIGLMEQYDLTKDDWDSIVEVGHFEGHRDPVASIPSKVKSAFTRAYNKSSHMRPYAMQSTVKKGRKGAGTASGDLQMMEEGEVDEEEAEEVDDRLENNAMIKVQKGKPGGGGGGGGKRGKGVKSESQETSASRKGKGKGKGKGKSDKK